jgi:hydrogenase maturation protease
MHTLVLGIGNNLLSDEGVGVHAITYLQTHFDDLPNTRYLDGGTLSFTLASDIEEADNLIIIDATQLKKVPGTVQAFINEEMDHFLGNQKKRSVHEVGLIDLISIARLTEQLPSNRALIGIQPEKVDWGEYPTEAVANAIPHACEHAIKLIREWHS